MSVPADAARPPACWTSTSSRARRGTASRALSEPALGHVLAAPGLGTPAALNTANQGVPPPARRHPGGLSPPDGSLGRQGLEQAHFLASHGEPSSLAGSSAGAWAWRWHLWSQPSRSRSRSALTGTASPTSAAPCFVLRFCSENAS